jgi:hypothetical protein
VALIVAGAISSVKIALMAVLPGTPVVGPGVEVAGTVSTTRGRVESGAAPVVKRQTYGLSSGSPLAMPMAPAMVAV